MGTNRKATWRLPCGQSVALQGGFPHKHNQASHIKQTSISRVRRTSEKYVAKVEKTASKPAFVNY
jgi:hypothetical protein